MPEFSKLTTEPNTDHKSFSEISLAGCYQRFSLFQNSNYCIIAIMTGKDIEKREIAPGVFMPVMGFGCCRSTSSPKKPD